MKLFKYAAVLPLCFSSVIAVQAASLDSDAKKFSYLQGYKAGKMVTAENPDFDMKSFNMAMEDALNGKDPKLSDEEIKAVVQSIQQKMIAKVKATAEKNLKAGEAYLKDNKKKEGVKTTPSGLQYQVIKKGNGKKPTSKDNVTVNYRGTLINGKEFDSSYSRNKPATFPVSGVVQGWQEALPMMKEGAKWKIFVPANLAYGMRGAPPNIGPNETLIFEIELLSISK